MNKLLLAMTMIFALAGMPHAAAEEADDCGDKLLEAKVPQEVTDAYKYFESLGLKNLLSEVDADQVKVSVRKKWRPFQAMVSARINWTGKKILVIRKSAVPRANLIEPDSPRRWIDVSTPAKLEKFRWQVAMSLFQLQMQPALWSHDALLPEGTSLPRTWSDIKDQGYEIPSEWRDQKLGMAQDLIHELYALFQSFQSLRAKDIMPAKDPGSKWALKIWILKDASLNIGPNLADYQKWNPEDTEDLDNSLITRHSRSILFNYYMNHFKRLMMISSVVSTLALAPQLLEIPSYIENYSSTGEFTTNLHQAPTQTEIIAQQTVNHRRQAEIARLTSEIAFQQKQPVRDNARIMSLKLELQNRVDESLGITGSAQASR